MRLGCVALGLVYLNGGVMRIGASKPGLGYLRAAALTAAVVMVGCAGSALANGDSVRVQTPVTVPDGVQYSITLRGFAVGRERLYLFVDLHACGANPSIEHRRADGFVWTVAGRFKEVSKHWVVRSGYVGLDHACGYLQKLSEPQNSPFGILAHGFTTYAAGIRVG
jgi:hypothetical protein